MSNREGMAVLCFAAPAVLLGLLLDEHGGWLVGVGAIGVVLGFAILGWNLIAADRKERAG